MWMRPKRWLDRLPALNASDVHDLMGSFICPPVPVKDQTAGKETEYAGRPARVGLFSQKSTKASDGGLNPIAELCHCT
jgi:hypothetical protein